MPDDLISIAQRYTAAAEAKDAAALNRLIRAYGRMYTRLASQIELLAEKVGDGAMTTGQLARLSQWAALRDQIEAELSDFGAYTKGELSNGAEDAIKRALSDSRNLIGAASGGAVTVGFGALPTGTITQLLGFLATSSPLYKRLTQLAPVNAKAIADLFVEGVGLGWNPRKIADMIRRQFGMALTDALCMTRTAQLYAYREATRATYLASDAVTGWYWLAAIGQPNTCMSCIRMHGTFHQKTERLNDHHNGRCAMVPAVKGFNSPFKQTGLEWFGQQTPATQQAYMGRDYYDAWKQGAYSLEDISTENDNDVYGLMRGVTPLHVLMGVK